MNVPPPPPPPLSLSRYSLSKAFFKRPAKFRLDDVFPCCKQKIHTHDDSELTLECLQDQSPKFISNITVNNWHIGSRAGKSHHLTVFSPDEVKVIGKYVDEKGEPVEALSLKDSGFHPRHMRLSSAVAISGAAVSFAMGKFETVFDSILELLALLGIGMGDEMVCNQVKEDKKGIWSKVRNCHDIVHHCPQPAIIMFPAEGGRGGVLL